MELLKLFECNERRFNNALDICESTSQEIEELRMENQKIGEKLNSLMDLVSKNVFSDKFSFFESLVEKVEGLTNKMDSIEKTINKPEVTKENISEAATEVSNNKAAYIEVNSKNKVSSTENFATNEVESNVREARSSNSQTPKTPKGKKVSTSDKNKKSNLVNKFIESARNTLKDTPKFSVPVCTRVAGKPTIVDHQNNNNDDNLRWKTAGKKNRERRYKGHVIGTARSRISDLKAAGRPFYFYVGQWDLNTNVEKMKRYIESFATVLEVVELGTKRSYRYFRSFKVTVESYYSNNMLNPENWPSGVKVARWFQRNNGKDINKAKKSPVNQPVTNMERAISKKNKATNNVIPGNSTVVASITIQSTAGVSNTNNNTEANTSNSESESGKEAVDLVLIESSTIDNIQRTLQ